MVHIISKEEQPLLGRTVVKATMGFEGTTPDRKAVRKELAKALGAKEDQVIVKRIRTSYGGQQVTIDAALYAHADDAKALERENLLAKHGDKAAAQEEKEASS